MAAGIQTTRAESAIDPNYRWRVYGTESLVRLCIAGDRYRESIRRGR